MILPYGIFTAAEIDDEPRDPEVHDPLKDAECAYGGCYSGWHTPPVPCRNAGKSPAEVKRRWVFPRLRVAQPSVASRLRRPLLPLWKKYICMI